MVVVSWSELGKSLSLNGGGGSGGGSTAVVLTAEEEKGIMSD